MLDDLASRDSMTRDQLEALGDEIATFAARIDVAKHALLTRLRVFDAHDAWAQTGAVSCAHWLSWRIGVDLKTAREQVRVARALAGLPELDAVFGRGELSYSKVRAITRIATAETEGELIELALRSTAAQLERLIRSYERCCEISVGGPARRPSELRFVRRLEGPGGMVRIEMQLPPEEAALVWEAIMSASARTDAEASQEASAEASGDIAEAAAAAIETVEAVEIAETVETAETVEAAEATETAEEASAEAFESAPTAPSLEDRQELEQRRADAMVDIARAYLQHRPRTLGSGYELVVITSREQLEHGHAGVGGFLRDGTPVPLHIARMLACDSARIDVAIGEHGELLDVGRSTRTIPSAIGRALWLRDGGCRAPGCGRRRHLHGHHIEGWAEGGPTKLSNLVLVCPAHHRMIHEGLLAIEVREGKLVFVDQRGRSIPAVAPSAATGCELEELERFLREAEVWIDERTNEPKWDGSRMDLGYTLDCLFGLEAPQPGEPQPEEPQPE